MFFFSSRRRHTRCALGTGVQTCALPICLAVNAFATGLDHPRWLYRLPNGDVLVAETNSPPRTGGGIAAVVMRRLMDKAGAGVPSANRITLLRDADHDGVAEARSEIGRASCRERVCQYV